MDFSGVDFSSAVAVLGLLLVAWVLRKTKPWQLITRSSYIRKG